MALLSVGDVSLRFRGIVALDGASFDVQPGTVTGPIGPNSARKTTVFNVVTRLYLPDEGLLCRLGHEVRASASPRLNGRPGPPRLASPAKGAGRVEPCTEGASCPE